MTTAPSAPAPTDPEAVTAPLPVGGTLDRGLALLGRRPRPVLVPALLLALAERPSWPRVDFEQLVAKLGLMPEGALDALNEAALEHQGDTVWDGEDPIEMNTRTLKELLA